MELFIANCSKQDFLFTYMLPENPRPFSHKIRAGAQIKLNQSQIEVDTVIKQHELYGMMEATKVKKGFGSLTYRVDKPISVDAIENGFTQSDQETKFDQKIEVIHEGEGQKGRGRPRKS